MAPPRAFAHPAWLRAVDAGDERIRALLAADRLEPAQLCRRRGARALLCGVRDALELVELDWGDGRNHP